MKNGLRYYCSEPGWPKVLNFHSVLPAINRADTFHSWNCSVTDAISSIDYVQKHFEIISEEEFIRIKYGNENGEGKFLITFDDGYASLHSHLREYMRGKGIRPVVFLIAGVYSDGIVPWYIALTQLIRHCPVRSIQLEQNTYDLDSRKGRFALYQLIESGAFTTPITKEQVVWGLINQYYPSYKELKQCDQDMRFLSKTQVRDLIEDGWSIGSHGFSHCPLTEVVPADLHKEVVRSKEILEELFGFSIKSISYPNGWHNRQVTNMVAEHYRLGFINNHSWNGVASPVHITRMYGRRMFDIHRVPFHRLWFSNSIDRYNKTNSKAKKLKIVGTAALRLPFSKMVRVRLERQLLLDSLKHYISLRRGTRVTNRLKEHTGVLLGAGSNSKTKPSLTVLCGPHAPERAAVAALSRVFSVDCVIIHNYARKPVRVFKGEDKTYASHTLFPHLHFSYNAQKMLGHDSLAWFVSSKTQVFSTSDINHTSVVEQVKRTKSDAVFVFGTGIIKSEILNQTVPVLNLHWGHSPDYRGSFTLRWPIYNKEISRIGITIHELTARLDGGGIVAQKQVPLDGSETLEDIETKATNIGIELIINIFKEYGQLGVINSTPQDLSMGKLYKSKEYTASVEAEIIELLENGVLFPRTDSMTVS